MYEVLDLKTQFRTQVSSTQFKCYFCFVELYYDLVGIY